MSAGEPVEGCQLVEVDGEPVRLHGHLETAEDHAAFAEVVRAARRRFEAERGVPRAIVTPGGVSVVHVDPGQAARVERAGRHCARRPRWWQLLAFVAVGVALGVAESVLLDLVDSLEVIA